MAIVFNYKKEIEAEVLFAEANKKLNNPETFEEALDMLYRISKDFPSFGKVYNHLGWVFETKFRDYKKAEENYKLALEMSPEYPATYENYAYVLERLGKLDELEDLLKKAFEQESTNKEAINRIYGRFYELKGDFDKAISQYKNAILHSFSNEDILDLQDSIKRCENKKTLLRVEE